MINTETPMLLSLQQVAKRLNVSPFTVRSWLKKGILQSVPICRRILIRPSDLEAFVNRAANNTTTDMER